MAKSKPSILANGGPPAFVLYDRQKQGWLKFDKGELKKDTPKLDYSELYYEGTIIKTKQERSLASDLIEAYPDRFDIMDIFQPAEEKE